MVFVFITALHFVFRLLVGCGVGKCRGCSGPSLYFACLESITWVATSSRSNRCMRLEASAGANLAASLPTPCLGPSAHGARSTLAVLLYGCCAALFAGLYLEEEMCKGQQKMPTARMPPPTARLAGKSLSLQRICTLGLCDACHEPKNTCGVVAEGMMKRAMHLRHAAQRGREEQKGGGGAARGFGNGGVRRRASPPVSPTAQSGPRPT